MRGILGMLFGKKERPLPPAFRPARLGSYEEYRKYIEMHRQDIEERLAFERNLLRDGKKKFKIHGYCYVCGGPAWFLVDFKSSYVVDGTRVPNWRERLVCAGCNLNNRMRAALHIFEQECGPTRSSKIYITEQTTPLYRWLRKNYPELVGSEHLGGSIPKGGLNFRGVRNEDLTRLSFPDNTFDYLLSFDVFEHIPDYQQAFIECLRCLRPGGIFCLSVPFIKTAERNVLRAFIDDRGDVQHLLPPEYHGDPLTRSGCLSFHHFGWQILNDMKGVGFADPKALLYWSPEFGYLGGEQVIFTGLKKPEPAV